MKNQVTAELREEITLSEMFGVDAENLLVIPAADDFEGEEISKGDLVFADSSRKAINSDLVLADIDGDTVIKRFDSLRPRLRLVTDGFEPDGHHDFDFQFIGVVVGTFRFREVGNA